MLIKITTIYVEWGFRRILWQELYLKLQLNIFFVKIIQKKTPFYSEIKTICTLKVLENNKMF